MHRVDPAGPLWRSSVWSDEGQIVRLHATEEQANEWARRVDDVLTNTYRGRSWMNSEQRARPAVPASTSMLRTRLAQLAQTCLARSQAVEPARLTDKPEPAKDLGDPRLGQPGVDLQLNGEPAPAPMSPGAIYSEPVRRYWHALFQICFDLLRQIEKRPATLPMPGRMGMVPCRYNCGRMVEQPAMLIALLAAEGRELSVGCGCFQPELGPPSEDSEPIEWPELPRRKPDEPHTIIELARTNAAERDAGTATAAMLRALPFLPERVVAQRVEPETESVPPPDDRDELEADPELDREPAREHPIPSDDDDWIF